uniref:Uncharacterized protein n=1 Tax=Rhizophora mucronata TaxID=61149 RepID=A0A2P2PDI4_RHIMU
MFFVFYFIYSSFESFPI